MIEDLRIDRLRKSLVLELLYRESQLPSQSVDSATLLAFQLGEGLDGAVFLATSEYR